MDSPFSAFTIGPVISDDMAPHVGWLAAAPGQATLA